MEKRYTLLIHFWHFYLKQIDKLSFIFLFKYKVTFTKKSIKLDFLKKLDFIRELIEKERKDEKEKQQQLEKNFVAYIAHKTSTIKVKISHIR